MPIRSYHAVERNLDLAAAAGASNILRTFPLPPGEQQAKLPEGDFVLASPLAGWGAKQWPLEYYSKLAERLHRECGMPLVLDAPYPLHVQGTETHVSTLAGLIYATRRATAVVGLDSGPLHLAAALGKQGVAIYGPTDPARHGPYGGTIAVLRSPDAVTTYRRTAEPDASMREITPDQVFEALEPILAAAQGSLSQIRSRMSVFPKPYADLVARLRVTCGFILVAAFAWFSRPDARSLAWGLPVSALGLVLRAWATGHVEKNIRLAESGPYAYVRNPLYLGTLLVAAGFAIASRQWPLAVLFGVVFRVHLPAGD